MKICILGNFIDSQTGLYMLEAFRTISSDIIGIDTRRMFHDLGSEETQNLIIPEILESMKKPDLIVVMKGLEITLNTLNNLRKEFPKTTIVNWFFDKYLGEKPIWDTESFFDTIKFYDYFFCSLKGVADKLNKMGFDNAKYLDEGCNIKYHGSVYLNHFQKEKYKGDISFIGSLGYLKQHNNRIPILEKIAKEGFNLNIWGPIVCEHKHIPNELRRCIKGYEVINEQHSMVVQSSLINLGIDQDPEIECGWSARLYRIMCAGGLYLTNPTHKLELFFKINKKGDELTGEEDLVVFYDEHDLIKKLDFLLEHDDIRNRIRQNGQKTVSENHTFTKRILEMMNIIKETK